AGKFLALTAWTVAACFLVFAILWPVLTGARPLFGRHRFRTGGEQEQAMIAYRAGITAYYSEDYREAERKFREALAHNPHSADANNMLAYALAEQGKLDDALSCSQVAMHDSNNSPIIVDTVAEMYERR